MLTAVVGVAAYKITPPPFTPLMLLRAGGRPWDYRWVPLQNMAPALPQAAMAAEDTTFCSHHGFDWEATQKAWDGFINRAAAAPGRAGTVRGGSTITQQTAKNVFLWP